jgi:succinate-acetate transporter protein
MTSATLNDSVPDHTLEKHQNLSSSNDAIDQDLPRVNHEITNTSFRHDNENIYINDVPINKKEFTLAFGGTFEVGAREKTRELIEYANPVPAGLGAFSASAISLGLVQMHAREVHAANTLLGAFLTTSGLVEVIVGILCFIIGNTWASCTFLMFGGFWSSYAFVLMDVGGISESYSSSYEYGQSVAIFFLPWALFSFFLWICTFKSTVALSLLMFLIWFFVLLFTIAQFIGSVNLFKAGGFFAIFAGCVGFYNMLAGLADKSNAYFTIKPMPLPNDYDPATEA